MEALQTFVASHNVAISATLLIIAYIFIALEKIPKVTIALLGGAITVILGLISQSKMAGDEINPHYFVNFKFDVDDTFRNVYVQTNLFMNNAISPCGKA